MDITIQRTSAEREFGFVRRMAERKHTIPVLAFARAVAADGIVRLAATDLESALTTTCPADIAEPGEALLPMRALHEVARAGSADTMHIQLIKGRIKVTCGGYVSTLPTHLIEDFPLIPSTDLDGVLLPSAALASALARVHFVAESDARHSSKSYWNGALLKVSPGQMVVTATDRHRVARVTATADSITGEASALLPKKALEDLSEMLDGVTDDVRFISTDGRAFFVVADRVLAATLLSGDLPNIDRVIPKPNGNRADIDRDAWREVLRRVRLVGDERTPSVRLSFRDQRLVAKVSSPERGEASEELLIELSGGGWSSAFNASYLAEFLQAAAPGPITVHQKDDVSVVLFTSGSDYLYAIAPMKL